MSPSRRPQLTSLVDMMTILLVFLLKSFSVEEERLVAADLALPVSTTEAAAPEVPAVVVARDAVLVDGRVVVDLTAGAPDHHAWTALTDALVARNGIDDPRGSRPGSVSSGRVAVQCDRDHEFALVKHVMDACRNAGYEGLALVVRREG